MVLPDFRESLKKIREHIFSCLCGHDVNRFCAVVLTRYLGLPVMAVMHWKTTGTCCHV